MYADDTTIYFKLGYFDSYHLKRDINNELEKITPWLIMNKLFLNVPKKIRIFYRKQKQISELNIAINDTDIERVESFSFLGLHIHESLSWKTHTDTVRNRVSKVVGILYTLKNIFPCIFYRHFITVQWCRTLIMDSFYGELSLIELSHYKRKQFV